MKPIDAAILSFTLLVAGCTAVPPPPGPELAPAPLPEVAPGLTLTWSSGVSETVTAVRGETVDWRDGDGNSFTAYRNFVLPQLAWDYPRTRAVTEVMAAPQALWPLTVGKAEHFRVIQRITEKIHGSERPYMNDWICRVAGTEALATRLGVFDTYRLTCARYWQGSNMGEVRWNYAPTLGVPVRRVWPDGSREELVGLSAGQPLPALADLESVRQEALERLPSGRRLERVSGGLAIAVTPVATHHGGDGFCRVHAVEIRSADARTLRSALACRGADGRWRDPTATDRLAAGQEGEHH
ncbi:MAG: hypothetical protein ACM33T_03870 [Solirubrobacterales bacterium]